MLRYDIINYYICPYSKYVRQSHILRLLKKSSPPHHTTMWYIVMVLHKSIIPYLTHFLLSYYCMCLSLLPDFFLFPYPCPFFECHFFCHILFSLLLPTRRHSSPQKYREFWFAKFLFKNTYNI